MYIKVRNNDVTKAYKALSRKLNTEGIFKKLKEKRFHQTKGEKRRLKHKEAVARIRRMERNKKEEEN
jgi:small subunit ribosomal protein S21